MRLGLEKAHSGIRRSFLDEVCHPVASLLIFLAASAAETGPELFQKAVTQERAAGNLEERIKLYQRVAGLDLGADDYMAKPFSVRELMARVRALLRRSQPAAEGVPALPDNLNFGESEIDFRSYEARRNGATLEMTRKEFAILRYLASRAGEVVTRDDLPNTVWGYDCYPSSRTVDNHVAGLRAKLEQDAAQPQHIKTVHGVGYKFVR